MDYDVAVVSAADSSFFDLLQGMVCSLRDQPQGRGIKLYVFDLGLSAAERRWLIVRGATLRAPLVESFGSGLALPLQALLSRCRIPELFPGHEIYLWIDADAWIQRWDAVETYVQYAAQAGFAITPETDPAYDRDSVAAAHGASFAMFDVPSLDSLSAGPVNAGVFAGRADAPHWQEWRRRIEAHIGKTHDSYLLFLLDQTALCLACTQSPLRTALLPPQCNWLCHFALPMVSSDGTTLLRPLPPHEPLGIVHQAAHTKRAFFPLRRPVGGGVSRPLGYQAPSQLPSGDYVSPGLQVILPDRCFPNMVLGDQSASDWPYLRRGLSHNWWVDRRIPSWGFLNRDEAQILYNTALRFCGKPGLEIGCLLGWSACHVAAAGVDLDVIDPLLEKPEVFTSVRDSLQATRFSGRVNLLPRRSPDAVAGLAKIRPGGWSFFFIDGDHDGAAPLNDAKACEPFAAADSAMVFHDLASPDVTAAVAYLKQRGWQIRVYHTAQIMAVAWRGDVRPVDHIPDPRIDWQIPEHLWPLLD